MKINHDLNKIDGLLNKTGVIPVVSTFTGSFRVSYGAVETIAGIVMSIFGLLAAAFRGNTQLLDRAGNHVMNGIGNVVRGTVEMIPIIGNIACYIVNSNDRFGHGSIIVR